MCAGGKCWSGDGTTGKVGEGLLYCGVDKHTVGTILPDPAGEALAGAVDRVAGAVVGAAADLGAGSAKAAAGTHCAKKEGKRKKKSQQQANN